MNAIRQTAVKAADMVTDITDGVMRVQSGHQVNLADAELAVVPEGFHHGGVFPYWLFRDIPASDRDRRFEVARSQIIALNQTPHNQDRMKNFHSQYPGWQVVSSTMIGEGRLALIETEDKKTQIKMWLFDQQIAWSTTEGSIDVVLPLSAIIVRLTNRDPHQWFLTYADRSKPPVKIACMTKNEAKDWLNYIWLCQIAKGLDGSKTSEVSGKNNTGSITASSKPVSQSGSTTSTGFTSNPKSNSKTPTSSTPSYKVKGTTTGPDPKQVQMQQQMHSLQQQQMKQMLMKQTQAMQALQAKSKLNELAQKQVTKTSLGAPPGGMPAPAASMMPSHQPPPASKQ